VIDFAMVWDWVVGDGSCGSRVSWIMGHGSRNVTHCQLWVEWLEIAQWLQITMESLSIRPSVTLVNC